MPDTSRNLPPVIRLFISSTFADMENERNYFATHLAPRMARAAAERGVSFFSVDLRWGITEEEQMNGEVLPICLSEIDRCRPFFLGILGNRYGSTLDEVTPALAESLPWLVGREGRGITELEMLYAVLDPAKGAAATDAVFAFRSERLSREYFPTEDERGRASLDALKERIRGTEYPSFDYDDIETFGEGVWESFSAWLDREFPPSADMAAARRAFYERELLRGYIERPSVTSFLDNYLAGARRPLLLSGIGKRGKTAALAAYQPTEGRRILVNCNADVAFSSPVAVLRTVLSEMDDARATALLALPTEREEERAELRRQLLELFGQYRADEPLTVILNDVEDSEGLLSYLPPMPSPSLRFLLSTADPEQVARAEALGFSVKELPLFDSEMAERYLTEHLRRYGKGLSDRQRAVLLSTPLCTVPGSAALIADFLILNGRFENLDRLTEELAACRTATDLYTYIHADMTASLTPRAAAALGTAMGLLALARLPLTERECYDAVNALSGTDPIEWAAVRGCLERLRVRMGDEWRMDSEELCAYATAMAAGDTERLHLRLADVYAGRRRDAASYAAVLEHLRLGKDAEGLLTAITHPELLLALAHTDGAAVRRAAIYLLTETDTPLRGVLTEHARQLADTEPLAAEVLCALLRELGMEESEPLPEGEAYSKDYREARADLLALYARKDMRRVAERTHAMLVSKLSRRTQEERLALLSLRTSAELALGRYESALSHLNEYHVTALRAADARAFSRALTARAELLIHMEDTEDAENTLLRAERLVSDHGDLDGIRTLARLRAEYLLREGKSAEATAAASHALMLAERQGRQRIPALCTLLRAYAASGAFHLADALLASDAAKTVSEEDARRLALAKAELADACGELEDAERLLTETADAAEAAGDEAVFEECLGALASLYDKTQRNYKATEPRERLLSLFLERKEYGRLRSTLKHLTSLLHRTGYGTKANETEATWLARLARLPGGAASHFDAASADHVHIERTEEEIHLARADGDHAGAAELLLSLARALAEGDPSAADARYREAMEEYSLAGDEDALREVRRAALVHLMNWGEARNEERMEALLAKATEGERRVISLWRRAGKDVPQEKLRDVWCGATPEERYRAGFSETVAELVEMAEEHAVLVVGALEDIARGIAARMRPKEIKALIERLTQLGADSEPFADALDAILMYGGEEMGTAMRNDLHSKATERMLAQQMHAVEILELVRPKNAAATAGNIALIFRRLKDEERTFRYHHLSATLYREAGVLYDALIEEMNLATAYKEFGDIKTSIEVLRRALAEAQREGEQYMAASLAGNLAGHLISAPPITDEAAEEIVRCFGIEEAYFEAQEEHKELVVSLLNQVVFYLRREEAGIAPETVLPKFERARALVEKYRITEFRQNVSQLGSVLSGMFGARNGGGAKQTSAKGSGAGSTAQGAGNRMGGNANGAQGAGNRMGGNANGAQGAGNRMGASSVGTGGNNTNGAPTRQSAAQGGVNRAPMRQGGINPPVPRGQWPNAKQLDTTARDKK